jgi:hypothetical protein
VPPEDFFDEDWEEPSKTQDTAVTRQSGGAPAGPQGGGEAPPTRRAEPRRRAPRQPRGGGLPPLEYGRLAMLAAGIILVILVGWLLVRVFSGSSGPSATDKYFDQEGRIAVASEHGGKVLHRLLFSPTLTTATLVAQLGAQVKAAENLEAQARELQPTRQLADVQPYLLQTLQYRTTGLSCLQENATAAVKAHPALAGGALMAGCMQRLLSSDVIYDDSYSTSASQALKNAGITHQVPTSRFLRPGDTSLVTPRGFAVVVKRLHPGSVTGIHGTGIGTVTANGTTLTAPGPITVNYKQGLSFTIVVKNTGNSEEVGVPVLVSLKFPNAAPVKKRTTVSSIPKGGSVRVTLPTSITHPQFTGEYHVHAMVGPVPGEKNLSNNSLNTTITLKLQS